jgi:murein DD-endopeptidase MepM/ murein hydrolase activator NlpD
MHLRSRVAVIVGLLLLGAGSIGPFVEPAQAATWVWPTTGHITQGYGCTGFYLEPAYGSCRHFHKGIDIANKAGTPIRAASSGVVTFVGWNPYDPACCRAWIVTIKHDNGLVGWYAHMKPLVVSGARKGDRVKAGQLIGNMGATGLATGVHLHFGLMSGSTPVNPRNYIKVPFASSYHRQSGGQATSRQVNLDGPSDQTTVLLPPTIERRYPLPV